MNLTIESMSKKNLKDIFDFELENKTYFEEVLPARPSAYFTYESFCELMYEILNQQSNSECYMCILRDSLGKMVGRVNFSKIVSEGEVRAEIGYRISKSEQGKGYASKAVKLMIEKGIDKFDLDTIEAGCSASNIGSQKVLMKNGFTQVATEKNVMKINGEFVDGILFEKKINKC